MISKTLQLPVDEVIEGTAATVALGIAQGCQIVRVHDIEQMKRVALMTDAIVRRD
jgi:dihydropteroate synthase